MQIGVVGKPNVGKTTFLSAATLAKAEIAPYPFTTIEANKGVSYVRAKCPHLEFKCTCNPRNSKCKDGVRYLPLEMIDVAGLVPDAYKGKGLGNKFLDKLRQASALIHIVDAAGATDLKGNLLPVGTHDPVEDVKFLEKEITYWVAGILTKQWDKMVRRIELEGIKLDKLLAERLTGLGITKGDVKEVFRKTSLSKEISKWGKEERFKFAAEIKKVSKPMIIAANKIDIAPEENLRKLKKLEYPVIPASAEAELALRRASEKNFIDYVPGDAGFEILTKELTGKQKDALRFIEKYLETHKNTGVQQCIEYAVFKLLNLIIVYPVEDEYKLTDKDGNVLPDAYLVPKGSTAQDLAYRVHSELGENFIRAVNARTCRVVGHDYELKHGDVIKIVAGK